MKMDIREAERNDRQAIIDIYNQAIATKWATADLTPVTVDDRRDWFREHKQGKYPIYVAELGGKVVGWCSLSPYRPGRMALRFTAEVSYYVDVGFRRRGVATALLNHAIRACSTLEISSIFGILLERNAPSIALLTKLGFQKWAHLPRVADFDGQECGHVYYGLRVDETENRSER